MSEKFIRAEEVAEVMEISVPYAYKIIRKLNEAGYNNIIAYDPVAMEEFQQYYKLGYICKDSYEETIQAADVLALATAWPMFKNVKDLTDKPVVDCRYML